LGFAVHAWKATREHHDRYIGGYTYNRAKNPNLARDQSARRKHPRVVTTRTMVEEGLHRGKDRRQNWYLPLTAPVDLPERALRLNPYLLGCWLGDGHTSGAAIASEDEEIVQAFRDAGYHMEPKALAGNARACSISDGYSSPKPWLQEVPDAALVDGRARVAAGEVARDVERELATRYGYARCDDVLHMLTGSGRPFAADDRRSFAAALIDLGVIRRKHIPDDYMRASAKQRLAVLQGVLDTGGTVTNRSGTVELCLVDRELLAQVRELVCSLGDKPGRIRRKVIRLRNGRDCEAWRFCWMPQGDVFRLPRKLACLNDRRNGRTSDRHTRRAVRAIESVLSVPVRCITVDSPSSLYLAGESMIPTHNTSFALGMASHAALVARKPVLFFSLEMSQLEITQRVLCSEARVDATRVRNGKLNENDWEKIGHAVGRLAEAPIWIDDNPNVTVMEIRSKARKLKSQIGDLGLVVVDYVQLMTGRTAAESRQVEVAEISRGLKILAREIETPVVALAQLNRGLEQRADKRPMLSDLRESGSLEQDADVVLFLYRDEIYNRESTDLGIAEVIVAKHRSGPTGMVRLAFLGQYTRFANMARS
jgi:replicative DNA helicase